MPIQVDTATLAGVIAEAALYGTFLVLFVMTLHTLVWKRKYAKLNIAMVVAACVMAVLATCQIIVDTVNMFRAFLYLDRASRIMFLNDATEPIFAAKHAVYFTMMFVGDMIVIYRAFIVWGGNYFIIAVPVLCSLGSAVCAYQTIWTVRHIATASIKSETKWGIAIFSLSLVANTIATSAVAFKVWQNERRFNSAFNNHGSRATGYRKSIMPVARIVAESGAVNAAYILVFTIILVNGTHADEVMSSISTPLVGILFSAIIIRAAILVENDMSTNLKSRGHAIELPSTGLNANGRTAV